MAGPWEQYAATAPVGPWSQYAPTPTPAAPQDEALSWADVPGKALSNLPASAMKFGEAVVQPILHPVDTAKAIGNLAYGVGSKAAGAVGVPQDPAKKAENEAVADAVGKFFADRYGSAEGFKKALAEDPVGVAGDLSVVLTGGGTVAARAPGVVGRAAQSAAAAGRAIDPLNVAGKAAKGAVTAPAAVLGVTTGTGGAPIRQAFEAGRAGSQAFPEHMRGARPLDEVVDMAKGAVSQMRQDRGAAYDAGMAGVRGSTAVMDINPIGVALRNLGDQLHFKGITKDPKALEVHGQITDKFNEFLQTLPRPQDRTPEAFDALKQAVGAIREQTQQGTNARRVADRVYNTIKNEITRQVPEYAATMKAYAEASDTIDEVGRTLSVNDKATRDTTLRKLQSVTRNNVNTTYGQRAKLADEITAFEPEFKNALAGQALNSWEPRGLARMGANVGAVGSLITNPMALAALPMASPRLVGEAAYGLGQGARVADTIGSAVGSDTILQMLLRAYQAGNVTRPLGYDD